VDRFPSFHGRSPAIVALRAQLARLLEQIGKGKLPPMLLVGETGTGKGLLARAIHAAGPRRSGPFIAVNCAAIPDTLLEAELFGFERGAFTGALQPKRGLFQTANGGTIFLDEVVLLSGGLQAKLLTVLEERAVRRLGATREEPIDVWIIAATNDDIEATVREGRFRHDLYHRLAALTFTLPPLRARGNDILILAEHLLARACAEHGLPRKTLSADARTALLAHPWMGNVRELANLMERVALLSDADVITATLLTLPGTTTRENGGTARSPVPAGVSSERAALHEALVATDWNVSRTAQRLGLSRNALRYRLEKHGLVPATPLRRGRPSERAPVGVAAVASAALAPATPSSVRFDRRALMILAVGVLGSAAADSLSGASRVLEMAVDKISGFGGVVEEVWPEGVIGVFGLDHDAEEAPRRAAHAATAIQHAARLDGAAAAAALHADTFLVGSVDGRLMRLGLEEKRRAWWLLEGLLARARGDLVLLSGNAATFLERRFDVLTVDHGDAPAYALAGKPRGTAGVAHRSRFVGRGAEMRALAAAFDAASSGSGRIVGLVGVAGIGKSRLIREVFAALRDADPRWWEGHCAAHGRSIPYLPLLDMLRTACDISEADAPAVTATKLRTALAGLGITTPEWTPPLLQLLGVPDARLRLARHTPESVMNRTFDALAGVVLHACLDRPLVAVVEDAHWIDRTSEEFLSWLAPRIAQARMLLLVSYRAGYRPPWLRLQHAREITLGPLGHEDGRGLARALVGDSADHDAIEAMLTRAGGNPFFIEELARAARTRGGTPPVVPPTVQAVLEARIADLPEQTREVLRIAAVLGPEIPLPVLTDMCSAMPALDVHLDELIRRELLTAGTDDTLRFVHALTQEVTYGTLSEPARQALHGAAGAAIERLHAGRLDEHLDLLAHHYGESVHGLKAAEYLERANVKAASAMALAEAATHFERAMALYDRMPDSDSNRRRRISLLVRQRMVMLHLGRFADYRAMLGQQRAAAESLGDAALLAAFFDRLGHCEWWFGRFDRSLELYREGLEVARSAGAADELETLHAGLRWTHVQRGDFVSALAVNTIRRDSAKETRHLARQLAAATVSYTALGRFREALAVAGELIGEADLANDRRLRCFANRTIARVFAFQGDLTAARRHAENAIGVASTPIERVWASGVVGWLRCRMGAVADGVPRLESALHEARASGCAAGEEFGLFLAEAVAADGNGDRAARIAGQVLHTTELCGMRWHAAIARRILGTLGGSVSSPDEAAAHFESALTTLREIGAENDLAATLVDRARFNVVRGRPGAARDDLTLALAIAERLGTIGRPATIRVALAELDSR
jgi:transcriptional regulator with AAA-type ATPase domain/tetratricopeptide (TPR) repeat protein